MKQYLKYWWSPGYTGYPSNTLPVHNVEKRRVPWNCVVFPIIFLRSQTPLLETAVLKSTFFLPSLCWKTFRYFFLHFSPPFCQSTWNNLWVLDFKDAPHSTYKSWPGEENGGPWPLFHHKCQMRTMNKLQLMLPTFAFSKRILTCLWDLLQIIFISISI